MVDYDLRPAGARGQMQLDWLSARFSLSFGDYQDPRRNGFGDLLALNEDVIRPGTGFEMHPHRNLEIFVIPLSGTVEHRDSLGNHARIRPGEIQKMSAGTGIWHSQMNASTDEVDHHLQVWLRPRINNTTPAIDQRHFDRTARVGRWQAWVTPDGRDSSLSVKQDASILATILLYQQRIPFYPRPDRSSYVHVISGEVDLIADRRPMVVLGTADAVAFSPAENFWLVGRAPQSEILLFDLAPPI